MYLSLQRGEKNVISWQREMSNMQHCGSYCWLTHANPEAAHHESSLWRLLFPLSLSFQHVAVSSLFWFLSFPVALLAESAIGQMAWLNVILIGPVSKNTGEVSSLLTTKISSLQLLFQRKYDLYYRRGSSLLYFPLSLAVVSVQRYQYCRSQSGRKFWVLCTSALLIRKIARVFLIVQNNQRISQWLLSLKQYFFLVWLAKHTMGPDVISQALCQKKPVFHNIP